MQFGFGPKSSILLIFFSQGIVFAFLLLKKAYENQTSSSKWLSLFVFLCSLYIAPFMFGYAGWYSDKLTREILFFIPFQQLFLLGPVLFFYTQSLLNKSFRLTRVDILHFTPAIAYLLYSLVVFVTDKWILDEYFFYADGRDKDLAPWYQMTGLISMLIYLLLSLRYYFTYKKLTFEVVSYAETILFKWIRNYLIAFLIILILRVLFFILNPEWAEFGSKFWYYLCFSGLFYYIALSGYANTVKASIPMPSFGKNEKSTSHLETQEGSEKPKETETGIPNIELWKSKISELMLKQNLYENPILALTDVASALSVQPKLVSQIVNQGFEMNFNDFINKYRVGAVIDKLESNEHLSKTILGIALECGFNSKATFNRAFKKSTGLTPKSFLVKISKT